MRSPLPCRIQNPEGIQIVCQQRVSATNPMPIGLPNLGSWGGGGGQTLLSRKLVKMQSLGEKEMQKLKIHSLATYAMLPLIKHPFCFLIGLFVCK